MSCAAACLRQLAKDNGMEFEEEIIRNFARTTEETGTYPDGMIDAMKEIFKDFNIDFGMKFNPKMTDIDMAKKLSEEGSWVAFVLPKNSSTQHAIIVDKIIDNKVYVRDPWPSIDSKKGTIGIMDLDEFEYIWKYAQNWCFRVINKK
ncbi:cysteine peptidase family C39 domain-containing protein [Chryseobacterium gambrini]|uniref:cysteine peptidase family C39 domain-containing protein n=1 Tax=Chryseobacterium gambrini TaxID=373672 RepID=UPI003BA724E9